MFAYVARQPIFDKQKNVFAYELLFRDGKQNCFPNIEPDEATSKLLTDSHLSFGIEEITGGKPAFINFHQNTLLYRFPTSLDPTNTIVEVVETVKVDKTLLGACKHIRDLGYKLALDDYDGSNHWDAFLDFTSIIKVEVGAYTDEELEQLVSKLKERNIKLVAERVETREQFEQYLAFGFDYFQGYFLSKPEMIRHRKMGGNKMAMLDLLAETGRVTLNVDRISAIFEQDATLTFKLLRFINTGSFNKRYSIKSLKHAINYMGEIELKKFIALLALANLSDSQPSELLTMSLVRAKFCEFMSKKLEICENPPLGYLTGLLSLMDVITALEMQIIIDKIPIDASVKDALCGDNGTLSEILKIASAFEKADWHTVNVLCQSQGLKKADVHEYYLQSLVWVDSIFAPEPSNE